MPGPPNPPAGGANPAALSVGSYSGTFSNVADAPQGTGKINGKATMLISAAGTKVTLLRPG